MRDDLYRVAWLDGCIDDCTPGALAGGAAAAVDRGTAGRSAIPLRARRPTRAGRVDALRGLLLGRPAGCLAGG